LDKIGGGPRGCRSTQTSEPRTLVAISPDYRAPAALLEDYTTSAFSTHASLSSTPTPTANNAGPATHSICSPTMTTYDDYGVPIGAYSEPEGLTHQAWRTARAFYLYRIRPLAGKVFGASGGGNWSFRRLFTLVNALVVLWWVVLYWGETGTFNSTVGSCSWDRWEKWVCHAGIRSLLQF